jgi:hypothetical protein
MKAQKHAVGCAFIACYYNVSIATIKYSYQRQLTQSPISCSRFSAVKASDMSSGFTRTSSWSVVCLPPNSSLCSESLLFFVAMMGNGGPEESLSPRKRVGGGNGRGVFADPPLFHEGIHRTLYAFPCGGGHGLGFVPPQHDHGDPAAGRETRRVGGAGFTTVREEGGQIPIPRKGPRAALTV